MGKHKDLIQVMSIVLIGMFIPFFCSITINYGCDLYKTASTFGYFLLIFGIELLVVILYFSITGKIANKKLNEYKSNKD